MRHKITLKHIAKELDVSISTVSKALKNSDEIGRETKEKVQAFAKLYNYKPNNIAISLKNKSTKNIGVIIPDIIHHFFTTVFRGIENYAGRKGYNVIACVSDESFDKEVINMEMLANGSVDGFIMALSAETQLKRDYNHLAEVTNQGIPLVLFDRVTDEVACDKVITNDRGAAFEATTRFISNGRQRIALITTDDFFTVSFARAEGYKEALRDAGMEVDEDLILRLPYLDSYLNIDEDSLERFFKEKDFDAALCVNEIFAICGMRVAQKVGKRVPEEVSIIGFTDGILSKFVSPSLSTMAQHGDRIGETAARLLIDKIEHVNSGREERYVTEVVEATLIQRESS